MRRLPLTLMALLCLLIPFSLTQAQPKGKNNTEQLTVYSWPLTKRPALEISAQQEFFDGLAYRYYLLENKAFKLIIKMQFPPRWHVTTPAMTESFAITEQGNPDNRLSFSIFKPDEFLPNFNLNTLLGYIESLKAKYGQRLKVLNQKTNFIPANQPFILNGNYRYIEYQVSQGANKEPMLYQEFIMFPDTKERLLFVIQRSGPAKRVEQTTPHIMSYLYNTELVDPETK